MSIETRLKFEKVCKWTAIIFMVLTMVNVFMPDLFVVSIEQEELTLDNRPQAFVRWFNAVAFLVIPIIAFFNKPTFKKIAVYFCLPMAIIYLCFFKEIMEFMTSPYGRGIYEIRFMPQAAKDFMINPNDARFTAPMNMMKESRNILRKTISISTTTRKKNCRLWRPLIIT